MRNDANSVIMAKYNGIMGVFQESWRYSFIGLDGAVP